MGVDDEAACGLGAAGVASGAELDGIDCCAHGGIPDRWIFHASSMASSTVVQSLRMISYSRYGASQLLNELSRTFSSTFFS